MNTAEPPDSATSVVDVAVGAVSVAFGFAPALLRRTIDQIDFARALLTKLGCHSAADGESGAGASLAPVVPLRPSADEEHGGKVVARTPPEASRPGNSPTPRLVSELAIPSYDELAASQVIPLLEGLRADELEAVRRHEAAGRGRRTVLSRIAQLQAG